jgi:hypothetical protein
VVVGGEVSVGAGGKVVGGTVVAGTVVAGGAVVVVVGVVAMMWRS